MFADIMKILHAWMPDNQEFTSLGIGTPERKLVSKVLNKKIVHNIFNKKFLSGNVPDLYSEHSYFQSCPGHLPS
jgi:hypothetical protein